MKGWVSILFCLAVIGFSACHKEDKPDTTYDKMLGKWRITEIAMDANGDGKMDNVETKTMLPNDVEYMVFGDNSNGYHMVTFNGVSNYYPFTWQLFNVTSDPGSEEGGTNLQRIIIDDTLTANIESLTEQRMIWRNNTQPAYSWYIMKKE